MPRSTTANLDQIKTSVRTLAEKSAKRQYTAEQERAAVQSRIDKLNAQVEALDAAVTLARETNEKNQAALEGLGEKRVEFTPPAKPEAPASESDGETVPEQLQEAVVENTDGGEPESAQARRAKRGQR